MKKGKLIKKRKVETSSIIDTGEIENQSISENRENLIESLNTEKETTFNFGFPDSSSFNSTNPNFPTMLPIITLPLPNPTPDLNHENPMITKSASYNENIKYYKYKIFEDEINSGVYPQTISKHWYPIDLMKNEGKYNVNFCKNVDFLANKGFPGWKRSRGDGNCYFRAVMVKYLEYLLRINTPITLLKEFIKLLRVDNQIQWPQEFINQKLKLLSWLSELYKLKRNDPVEAFIDFIKLTQNSEFDISFVFTARLLSAHMYSHDDLRPFFDENKDTFFHKLLTLGEEAEGLSLLALPLSLSIQVSQYNFFDTNVNIVNYPEENNGLQTTVAIVRRGGHYDILYSTQELEDDQYNLVTGCYHFPKA